MRFMLDESNDTILLNKEIEYLNSYIDLQKLRFSEKDDIRITFIIKGGTENIMIPPFLFIVFIENAFKYGINFKKPSFIDVQFEIDCESLKFHVKNSVHIKNETEKQGIGLVNVKERLKLLYKEDQSLKIINDIGTFNVDLIIKLNHVK
jgi:LytS/YehU family sensor histidine kinase